MKHFKYILLFVCIIISIQSFAQNPANYQYRVVYERLRGLMPDSVFHLPRYNGVPSGLRGGSSTHDGALAADTLNGRVYFYWNAVWNRLALFADIATNSANISNTSLTANNDYTQSWAGFQFKFDSIGIYQVQSRTSSATPRYTLLGGKALPTGYDIYSQFNDANGTGIQINNSSGGSNTYIESFSTNSTNLSSFQVLPDSIVFKPDAGAMTIDSLRVANSDTNGYKPMVWNQFNKSWRYFNSWGELGIGAAGWALTGNSLTAGSETGHFIGSTNNVSMRFRTNNTQRMVLDSLGRLEINSPAFISNGDNIVTKAKNSSAFNYNLFLGNSSNEAVFSVSNDGIVAVGNFRSFVVGGSSATATFNGVATFNSRAVAANRLLLQQGADIASSAGAITLGDDGNAFEITGTAAITRISNVNWQNGSTITLVFTSTASLTHGTANSGTDIGFELGGGINFTGSAGANITLTLSEVGGTQRWREVGRGVGQTRGIDDVLAVGQALTTSRTISTGVNSLTVSGTASGYTFIGENSNANGYSIRGLNTGGGRAGFFVTVAAGTNDESNVLLVARETAGTAAAGLTSSIELGQEVTSGNIQTTGEIKGSLTVADANNFSGKVQITTRTDTEEHQVLELSGPKGMLLTRDSTVDHTVERIAAFGDYKTLTEASATAFVRVNIPTGTVSGGEILITVEANDATDFQARTLRFAWSAVNKGGTITANVATPEESVAVSAGTLTVTIDTNDAGSGNLDFRANATSSLTQTTLRANHQIRKNIGTGTITAQ